MIYSRKNKGVADAIKQHLHSADIDVWDDEVGLSTGTPDWDQAVREAVKQASSVLWLASPDANQSAFARDELALSDLYKKKIYPVWVDGDSWIEAVPMGKASIQFIDARGASFEDGINTLIQAIKSSE